MRPGPGLVVMALAFISGARRGTSQQHSSSAASSSNKLGKFEEDNTEALSRINPWLSACDLAQPNTAPDLQVSIRNFFFNPPSPLPPPSPVFSPSYPYNPKSFSSRKLPAKISQPNNWVLSPAAERTLRSGTSWIEPRSGCSLN